jgi:hypothetical protein
VIFRKFLLYEICLIMIIGGKIKASVRRGRDKLRLQDQASAG